jgi:hypothetical protein
MLFTIVITPSTPMLQTASLGLRWAMFATFAALQPFWSYNFICSYALFGLNCFAAHAKVRTDP